MKSKVIIPAVGLLFLLVLSQPVTAAWIKTNGPAYVEITCLAVHGNELYAGTAKGMYRSVDAGASWTLFFARMSTSIFYSIGFCGSRIFVGTRGGFYMSADNGLNWTNIRVATPAVLNDYPVIAIGVDGNNVYAGTDWGLFVSADSGRTWKAGDFYPSTTALITYKNSVYIGVDNSPGRIIRSPDRGETWIFDSSAGISEVNSFCTIDDTLFTGTENGLFRSTIETSEWTKVSSAPGRGINALYYFDGCLLAGGTNGIFRSVDNGITWSKVVAGLTKSDIRAFTGAGSTIYAGTHQGGIFKSTDGGLHWREVNNGIPGIPVMALTTCGNTLLAGTENGITDGGIYRSVDDGNTWSETDSGEPELGVNALFTSDSIVFAGTWRSLLRSTDGGQTWRQEEADTGLQDYEVEAITTTESMIFAALPYGIYRKGDTGTGWSKCFQVAGPHCFSVLGNRIFAGTQQGILLSDDNGVSWEHADSGITNKYVYTLSTHGNRLFAGTVGGLFQSVDSGVLWHKIMAGQADSIIRSMIILDSCIITGTWSGGIFFSPDWGATWTNASKGIQDSTIYTLAVMGDTLFAGSNNGVWRLPLSELGDSLASSHHTRINAVSDIRLSLAVQQNRLVAINFVLNQPDRISIQFFTMAGKSIRILADTRFTSGKHTIIWDAHGVTNGCYLMKLTSATGSCIRSVPVF